MSWGVIRPSAPWRCSALYQGKNRRQNVSASSDAPTRAGKSGRYLRVLNWASEKGLSSETWGRECEGTTPRVASSRATGWEVIDGPRAAWEGGRPGGVCWGPD